MNACCRDDVARFLAGRLDTTEESAFIDHIETCTDCRQRLEADAGSDQHWRWARELLSFSGGPAPPGAASLAQPPRASLEETTWPPEIVDLSALSFLAAVR